jgi:hypothetical protein
MDLMEKEIVVLKQRVKCLEEIVEKLVNRPFSNTGQYKSVNEYDEDTRDLWRSSQQLFFDNGPNAEDDGIGMD